jgi:hypothetical protein
VGWDIKKTCKIYCLTGTNFPLFTAHKTKVMSHAIANIIVTKIANPMAAPPVKFRNMTSAIKIPPSDPVTTNATSADQIGKFLTRICLLQCGHLMFDGERERISLHTEMLVSQMGQKVLYSIFYLLLRQRS